MSLILSHTHSFSAGAMACPWYAIKGNMVVNEKFAPEDVTFPMKHMQKDMRLALELGSEVGQRLTVAKETDAYFRESMEEGHSDNDLINIYDSVTRHRPSS